jgi:hypothetical protein
MLVHEEDRLLAELRRVLVVVDPVPLTVKLAAHDALRWRGSELDRLLADDRAILDDPN